MAGVGAMSKADALATGCVGPIARACGIDYDVRRDHPYSVYPEVEFDVPLGTHGDCYDRYLVRIEEMKQSERILRQCAKLIPGGEGPTPRKEWIIDDWRYALPDKEAVYGSIEGVMAHFKIIMEGIQVPAGETYLAVEGGNGKLGFYIVSEGGGRPYRIRVRPPCFIAMGAFHEMIRGYMIADIIPTFGMINMIGGECDR
jgi:NADH-quinone oxidoreductase subunit D